jgi:hypothetical protein
VRHRRLHRHSTFEALANETQCASTVKRLDPDCSCEAHTASQWSPGPVADGEAQAIKAAAFDDCTGQGLSVERLGYSSLEQLQARAEAKAANDRQRGRERQTLGFVIAQAGEIRALPDSLPGARE